MPRRNDAMGRAPRFASLVVLSLILPVGLSACSGMVEESVADVVDGAPTSPSSASPTDTVSVPVTPSSSSTPRILVQVSVGGGDPFIVELDTGSTGLLVDQSLVGSDVALTGKSHTTKYVQQSVTADLATAAVGIGEVSTASPITVGLVSHADAATAFSDGASGIMGVAPADEGTADGLYSPFIQLPAPFNRGFQIDMPASGGGTLQIGEPSAGPQTVTIALTELSAPAAIAGVSFWGKDVTLCWTAGSLASACAATDIDSGAPRTAFNSSTVTGLPEEAGLVAPGQSIALATSTGQPLWSFTTGTTPGQDAVALEQLSDETTYNTGIGLFYAQVVGFDWADGELQLTPR